MFALSSSIVSYGRLAIQHSVKQGTRLSAVSSGIHTPSFSSEANDSSLTPEQRAVLHHGLRPRIRTEKFKSPRKRASKLMHELQTEAMERDKETKPTVWNTKFRVGDAIEIVIGRENAEKREIEKVRGVVIGINRKGLDHSVLLRDVVFGQPVERRIPLHSPLIQSVTLVEENFVYKGKRKVKRAKLYYLRDRNPEMTRVTKW